MKKKRASDSNIWQKIGLFFYDKKVVTLAIWVVVLLYGAFSYTTFMRREGFPSVEVPIGVVRVISFDESAEAVDEAFVQPIISRASESPSIKDIDTTATDQGATIQLTFERGTDVQSELDALKNRVGDSLPTNGQAVYIKVNASKLTTEGDDILVSVHGDLSAQELDTAAEKLVPILKNSVPLARDVRVFSLIESVQDPTTGETESLQVRFDRYFDKESSKTVPSVAVGIAGVPDVDQLKLYDQVLAALESNEAKSIGAEAKVAVDFAESIREQTSGLQRNLVEGLIVVLIVSFILISLRASVVTAVSMTTTLAITIGILELIGYSLNTITLFSLVLCLALIVDDTTIVVEAIDSGMKKAKSFREVVRISLGKVVRASATGTFTTMLAFAPMLFIGGILGEFIRAIPVTIIISLAVSLVVSFVFIPLFMWLSYRKGTAKEKVGVVGRLEQRFGNFLAGLILWSTQSKTRSIAVKLHAVLFAVLFVIAGAFIGRTLEFNIFPSPKDGTEIFLSAEVKQKDSATIEGVELVADAMLADVQRIGGEGIERITLLSQAGFADRDGFNASIVLNSIKERDTTSVALAQQLQKELEVTYTDLIVNADAAGVGPPAGAFAVQIKTNGSVDGAQKLSEDLKRYLEQVTLERVDGTTAKLVDVQTTPSVIVSRSGQDRVLTVTAGFDAKDVSTLVSIAQDRVESEFPEDRVSSYGLDRNAVQFDFGQEEENQESFASMGRAAGPLFLAMIILMAVLFKSVLQSLLILNALPFAFFGVMAGLSLTNNAISFFTMLGIFALVGISVNNAILLTDYANQERDKGVPIPEAMAHAIKMRLRPLLTTSMTSILALLPLALNDPFWEGIAYTLIFGLLSSTLLVIFIFPYFYLIEEGLRMRIRHLFRRA